MNREGVDDLMKKYLKGTSTLEEEELLFARERGDEPMGSWSQFVQQTRKRTPNDFSDELWKKSVIHKLHQRRYIRPFMMAAASLLVLFLAGFLLMRPKGMSYEEKQLLLHETLALFSDNQEPVGRKIIYEDQVVVIYAEDANKN